MNNANPISTERFWKPQDVAQSLGVPVSWVYDRTQQNGPEQIPHLKLGKYLRFNPRDEAFSQWLKQHEIDPIIDNLHDGA